MKRGQGRSLTYHPESEVPHPSPASCRGHSARRSFVIRAATCLFSVFASKCLALHMPQTYCSRFLLPRSSQE